MLKFKSRNPKIRIPAFSRLSKVNWGQIKKPILQIMSPFSILFWGRELGATEKRRAIAYSAIALFGSFYYPNFGMTKKGA